MTVDYNSEARALLQGVLADYPQWESYARSYDPEDDQEAKPRERLGPIVRRLRVDGVSELARFSRADGAAGGTVVFWTGSPVRSSPD